MREVWHKRAVIDVYFSNRSTQRKGLCAFGANSMAPRGNRVSVNSTILRYGEQTNGPVQHSWATPIGKQATGVAKTAIRRTAGALVAVFCCDRRRTVCCTSACGPGL
jgi:hypothetical protein